MTTTQSTGVAVPEIDQHRERLVAEHTGRGHTEADVRERLDRVCRRLAGARVRSYLPVLVERALREELRGTLAA